MVAPFVDVMREEKVAYCTVKTLLHNLIFQEKLPHAVKITCS